MATKMKKVPPAYRKISKPVISTDVMGNRNVEVRAVGAWVQVEASPTDAEAVIAAEQEEQRVHQIQLEKQARLRHFQQEVKKRVNRLDKLKKQAQLETNFKAAEQERNIVCQSAFSSQDFAKKDNCIVRPQSALAVDKLSSSKSGKEDTEETYAFTDQTNQVHQYVNHAKKNLVSRQVITHNYVADDLPGGIWKISRTRDLKEKDIHPSSRYTVDGEEFDLLDEELIEKVKVINNKAYGVEGDKENLVTETAESDRPRSVQFDIEPEKRETREERIERRSQSANAFRGTDINRNIPSVRVPNIYEGVQSENEKRRARSQQAMYRRLFMDLEREQVKENLRRQEHRKRIMKLKKEKEEERIREEQISQQMIEPRDPVTGETSIEALEREEHEKRFIRQTIREHERRVKKAREMERYIEALRQQLKDKVQRRKVELPPLCCCGESVWDTNPETCANNCIFYKNPKEYGRALQTLLDSSELLP